MRRRRKTTDNQAWAALALLENNPSMIQEEVAELLGVSRTELRRVFERLAEENETEFPDIRDRVKTLRSQISDQRKRRGRLTKRDVENIRLINEHVPWMNQGEIAEMFGVSRATVYRSFQVYGEDETNYFVDGPLEASANLYVPMAADALDQLNIPNDLSEHSRDLFLNLRKSVNQLRAQVSTQLDINKDLHRQNAYLRSLIDAQVPLWEEAWKKFILNAAESAGTTSGKGAVFAAGFIAGSLIRALR